MFKLLKHDIRDSYLEVVILCGALLLASVVTMLGIVVLNPFLMGIGGLMWTILAFAIGFVILKIVVKNFHSKLFTNVGYLTLTTPVSIDKILISKILVSMLWNFAAMLTIIVSYVIIIAGMMSFVSPDVLIEFFGYFGEYIIRAVRAITFNQILFVIEGGLVALTGSVASIVTLLFVLTLVNTGRGRKYKFIKALVIYIGLTNVLYIFWYIMIFSFLPGIIRFGPEVFLHLLLWAIIIINILWIVGLYIGSRMLIIKKLELE